MQNVQQVLSRLPIPLFSSSGKTTGRPKPASGWAAMLHACLFQLQGILLCPALDIVKHMVRGAANTWLAFAEEGRIRKSLCMDNSPSGTKERQTSISQVNICITAAVSWTSLLTPQERVWGKILFPEGLGAETPDFQSMKACVQFCLISTGVSERPALLTFMGHKITELD